MISRKRNVGKKQRKTLFKKFINQMPESSDSEEESKADLRSDFKNSDNSQESFKGFLGVQKKNVLGKGLMFSTFTNKTNNFGLIEEDNGIIFLFWVI